MAWKWFSVFVMVAAAGCGRVVSPSPDSVERTYAPPTVLAGEARAYWEGTSPEWPRVHVGADQIILAAEGETDVRQPIVMRLNDDFPNGRSLYHDAVAELDDDLQQLWVHVPREVSDEATLTFDFGGATGVSLFSTNWLDASAAIEGAWEFGASPYRRSGSGWIPLWMRVDGDGGQGVFFRCTVRCHDEGVERGKSERDFRVAGTLGDPDFFTGVADYLGEGDGGELPKYFTCEVKAASSATEGTFEVLRFAALPKGRTRMTVHETYHAQQALGGLDGSIFDVAARFPAAAFIVNGNYFRNAKNAANHGDDCLGAVIVDGVVTPASRPHRWGNAHKENLLPFEAPWSYAVYALVQDDRECGHLRLVEETRPPGQLFVPKEDDGSLPYMALGGLHTLHQFVNNVGANKSHFWMTDDLVCFAMSDPKRSDSTTGELALRDMLRASGLVIEEGELFNNVAPGHSDLLYLDGGTSICMALQTEKGFDIPIAAGRNSAENNTTRVNNYLVFYVDDCS